MNVVFYDDEQYAVLAASWLENYYGVGSFPEDFFPTTGICVCDNEGNPFFIMPVYLEQSSSVAVAGHCVFNPGNTPKVNHKATELAIDNLVRFAQEHKKKFIITMWGRKSISRMAEKKGYLNTDIVQQQIKGVPSWQIR